MRTTTSLCASAVVCAALYAQTTVVVGENIEGLQNTQTNQVFLVKATSEAPINILEVTQPLVVVTRSAPDFSRLIRDAADDAAEDGWDGAGTVAVDSQTVERALRIAGMLPAFLPEPEVSITPSGSISFDWYKGAACLFSVMVPRAGGVSFAALFSGDRLNGAMNFVADRLPQEITSAAERWNAG